MEAKAESKIEPATHEDAANVVAIQLSTSLIKFDHKLADVTKLIEGNQEYKKLSADDKPKYDLAIKAIAEVRTMRTDIDKQRKAYKAPVTVFGKAVEDRAKELIGPLKEFEDTLKLEKQRIDDIKAERKAAIREAELRERQAQLDRLNEIRNMYLDTASLSLEALNHALEHVTGLCFDPNDYGESFDDAKQALGSVRIRLNTAIAQAEQAIEQAEQAAEIKRQQAQAETARLAQKKIDDDAKAARASEIAKEEKERKEKDKEASDKAAAQQKIIDDLQAQNDKLKEDKKPVKEMDDDQFIEELGDIDPSKNVEIVNPEIYGGSGGDCLDVAKAVIEDDAGNINDWIDGIQHMIDSAPVASHEKLRAAVDRVSLSMKNGCKFLESSIETAKQGDLP